MKKNDKQAAAKATKNPETNRVESPSATAEVIEKNSEAKESESEESETEQPELESSDETNQGSDQPVIEEPEEVKEEGELPPVEKKEEEDSAHKENSQEVPGNNLKLPEVNALSATAEVIRSSATEVIEDKRLVRVLIQYPEGYTGPRHLKDGKEYDVSPESAELFIQKGFGTKVNKTN